MAEKRRPNASVASMLVTENSDAAAVAQQLDGFTKTLATFKGLETKTSSGTANVPVDERVYKPLINGRFAIFRNASVRYLREISQATVPASCPIPKRTGNGSRLSSQMPAR